MELILFNRPEFARLYNCTFYSVDSIPLEKRQHIAHGVVFLTLFCIFEIMYIPCLYEMLSSKNIRLPCYKLMALLGFSDILLMCGSGLLCGLFTITGTVYCSMPTAMMIFCFIDMGLWGTECCTSMILAFNRCCVMYDPKGWAAGLFEGKKIWFWIMLSLTYGSVGAVLSKPILFSSIYVASFFNPHMGYFEDTQQVYVNIFHTLNNFTVFLGLTSIYLIFAALTVKRRNKCQVGGGLNFKRQLSLFVQIFLISLLYAFTSGVYIYIQFFKSSELVILAGSYTFLLAQGAPPFFYAFLNKTIRRGLKRKLCGKFYKDGRVLPTTSATYVSSK